MTSGVPRTVKAVSTPELVRLDSQAIEFRLNRNHGAGWLTRYADPEATHFLRPFLLHRLSHRPEVSPHVRCMLLLRMRDGQQIFSLLDVMPASFDALPDTLDAAAMARIVHLLDHGGLPTQAEWASGNT
ncbi:hypothetical protein AB0M47_27325 [Hamadaea sp. NPDC051192]|uniref:hypothetical protein n=1 Tax=Hamadaea sp. NPDC051192 TaxID=3154940 RepID=UPI00341EAFD9